MVLQRRPPTSLRYQASDSPGAVCLELTLVYVIYNARRLHKTAAAKRDETGVAQITPRSLDVGDACGRYGGPIGDIGPS